MYISDDILIFVQAIVAGLSIIVGGFYVIGYSWKYSEFVYLEYDDEYKYNHTLFGFYGFFRFKYKYKEVRSKYYYYVFKSFMSVLLVTSFNYLFVISI